jgi:MYXO-CTERM domain-containing protein
MRCWLAALPLFVSSMGSAVAVPSTATVGGTTYTVHELVGVGRIAANTRDSFGETFGSISGLLPDTAAWRRTTSGYEGRFFSLPDRGYNAVGTIDYIPRINTLTFSFTPAAAGSSGNGQTQIALSLTQSVRLFEQATGGSPQFLTGLDPKPGGVAQGGARPAAGGQPELPQAVNGKLSLDAEGLVRLGDGTWLISDEYGPSIYRFANDGRLLNAFPVAASVRPLRNGVTDYSSNNPAAGGPAPSPANPTAGRQNNQGFEGMSLAPDGKTLIVVLQSAARQDLNTGSVASTRRNTRVFTYDVSNPDAPMLTGEYALQLPTFLNAGGATQVAAQSEILALSATRFLILPRDGNGFGTSTAESRYRQVDIVDLTGATNILGLPIENQIAPGGVLNSAITPASLAPWLNINTNAQLNRFGLRNGGANDRNNLSDKWEGLALLPTFEPGLPDEYFLFVANDNDFLTSDGFQAGSPYTATVGGQPIDSDTVFLAYRVTVPGLQTSEPATLAVLAIGLCALAALRRRRAAA